MPRYQYKQNNMHIVLDSTNCNIISRCWEWNIMPVFWWLRFLFLLWIVSTFNQAPKLRLVDFPGLSVSCCVISKINPTDGIAGIICPSITLIDPELHRSGTSSWGYGCCASILLLSITLTWMNVGSPGITRSVIREFSAWIYGYGLIVQIDSIVCWLQIITHALSIQ